MGLSEQDLAFLEELGPGTQFLNPIFQAAAGRFTDSMRRKYDDVSDDDLARVMIDFARSLTSLLMTGMPGDSYPEALTGYVMMLTRAAVDLSELSRGDVL